MFKRPVQPEEDKPDKPGQNITRQFGCSSALIWIILLIFLVPWAIRYFFNGEDQGTQISYTVFRQQVEAGNVSQVTVSGEQIRGELIQPIEAPVPEGEVIPEGGIRQITDFITYLPTFGDEGLFPLLQQHNVIIETQPEQTFSWGILLLNILPFLVFLGIGFYLFSRMRAQGQNVFSFGKSRAKLYDRERAQTTFADVAGAHGAKRELQEIVEYLKDSSRFERLGGAIPKGVLLVGPPGTGKTLLARAVAGEANAPFFSITGSDFMEMFVGVGASRVRELFKEAKDAAPSIIFIDELDSIGRRRGAGLGGGHDEREQTLNQLLSELDGFEPNENVIVMAATNRPDILDPALLRPGRFDRRVSVDLPTMMDRIDILKIHARNKPLAADVDLEKIARGTPGFSGADLENLLNEAALLAARRGKDQIEKQDVDDARDKVLMGLERENLILTEDELRLLAYHEAGHAVVAAVLPHADPIHKVTIVPRGQAMGVTQQLPERDRYLYPRDYMLDRLAVTMGGRAAEKLFLNTITSGAENDLQQATFLARKMVLSWGMSERLGHVSLGGEREEVFLGEEIVHRREYSEATAREIDIEVKKILDGAFDRATETLKEYRQGLEKVVEALLEKEDIPGQMVLELVGVKEKRPAGRQDGSAELGVDAAEEASR